MWNHLLLVCCLSTTVVFGQNHEENLRAVTTVQEANDYAASFSEVSCGLMHSEKDIVFFDDIDTANLASHVGTSRSFFGRTTKLIKDSIVNVVNVQIITFDLSQMSSETAEILLGQMEKRLANGESYWDIKQKFGHTSAQFSSAPEIVEKVETTYNITEEQMTLGSYYRWERLGSTNKIGLLIVDGEPHEVPGFFTISYLNLNNGNLR